MNGDIDHGGKAGSLVDEKKRYHSLIIVLHWLMALGIFAMLASGAAMTTLELDQSLKFKLYQWHKGGGVLLLIAFGLRLITRLITVIPEWPSAMPKKERFAAKTGHWGLYILMIVMPLSGWMMVSSSVYGLPTIVFDLFEWPHIPGIESNRTVHDLAKSAHYWLAILFALMIAGHIGAVIKHAVMDQQNLLHRIWWGNHKNPDDK